MCLRRPESHGFLETKPHGLNEIARLYRNRAWDSTQAFLWHIFCSLWGQCGKPA